MHDDKYFVPFKLTFRERTHTRENRFQGKYYESLGEYKTRFDLRPIRNIIVRQNSSDDDSAIYEIFNRLNSGGVNLRPQEIRASLYHSAFYDMLHHINADPAWRRLVGRAEPDLHGKDLEILLRGFAMLEDGDNYAPSMIKFLNQFSLKRKKTKPENNEYLENLFKSFLHACSDLPDNVFFTERSRRFNIALYDAVFSVVCRSAFSNKQLIDGKIEARSVRNLEVDSHFIAATRYGTTKTVNVKTRMERAKTLIKMI
ncbi:MAG: hypothetical protein HUU55_18740 [Myxococcales bacterium]|nr:hypothetical protein [Myxococcales bacterium]